MAKDCDYPVSLDAAPTDRAQGDVVPSSDLNKYFDAAVFLENTVGITGSAVTTSLNYKLTNAASIEPGHLHKGLYDSAGSTVCVSAWYYLAQSNYRAVALGNVPYLWPSTAATTGAALRGDDLGNITWGAHIKVRLFADTVHGVGTGASHILLCDGRSFDTAEVSDIVTNKGRITPGIAGYYMVGGTTHGTGVAVGQQWVSSIYVDDVEVLRGTRGDPGAASNQGSSVAGIVKLTSTNYVEMYVFNGDSATVNWVAGTAVSYIWLFGPL